MTSAIGSLSKMLCLLTFFGSASAWIVDFVKNHLLTTAHVFLVFALLLSSWAWSGTKWLSVIACYILFFSIVAFGFHKPIQKVMRWTASKLSPKTAKLANTVNAVALVFIFCFPILWFFVLNAMPLWSTLMSQDFYGVARIRSSLTYDAPWWLPYGVEYFLKGIAPFFLLLLYRQKSKLFYPTLAMAWFFALSMLARTYVIVLFAPLMIYQFGEKQWLPAVRTGLAITLSLTFLCFLANPQVWPRPWLPPAESSQVVLQSKKVVTTPTSNENLTVKTLASETGLDFLHRAFFVPGQVTDEWLSLVPGKQPFLHGCGYKKLAYFLGCDFVNMPFVVFADVYPHLTGEDGYRGSVTASHFINDYVNFGYMGLLFSALITALLLASIESAPANRLVIFALNILPITLLNEMTLSSVVHTGGMFLLNFLYFVNRASFAKESPPKSST